MSFQTILYKTKVRSCSQFGIMLKSGRDESVMLVPETCQWVGDTYVTYLLTWTDL